VAWDEMLLLVFFLLFSGNEEESNPPAAPSGRGSGSGVAFWSAFFSLLPFGGLFEQLNSFFVLDFEN